MNIWALVWRVGGTDLILLRIHAKPRTKQASQISSIAFLCALSHSQNTYKPWPQYFTCKDLRTLSIFSYSVYQRPAFPQSKALWSIKVYVKLVIIFHIQSLVTKYTIQTTFWRPKLCGLISGKEEESGTKKPGEDSIQVVLDLRPQPSPKFMSLSETLVKWV